MHTMTSSNGNIFRVTGHLCGEFTGPRWIPRTKAGDAELWFFLDLHLNKRSSKQSWGCWLETSSRPFWRHHNELMSHSLPMWWDMVSSKYNDPCPSMLLCQFHSRQKSFSEVRLNKRKPPSKSNHMTYMYHDTYATKNHGIALMLVKRCRNTCYVYLI